MLNKPSAWHKRQAMLLASQLPEKNLDARMILQVMQELVENYLGDDELENIRSRPTLLPFPA